VTRLRVVIGLAVSLALMWLVLSRVSLGGLLGSFLSADYRSLAPAVGVFFLGVLVRSLRWKLLLDPIARVSLSRLFRAVVIGFTVNNLLPARLGELARAMLLLRWAGVPPAASIGTLVVERLFDGLALCGILGVAWLWVAPTGPVRDAALLAFLGFGLGGLAVGVAALRPELCLALARVAIGWIPARYRARGLRLASELLTGMAVVRDPRVLLSVAGLSLAAWVAEASMYYLIMLGFGLGTGPIAALLGMAAANLGTMIPSSPGYIGTFDFLLNAVLVDLFGADRDVATSYTLVVHAALIVPVVILGLFFLSREGLSLREVGRRTGRHRLSLGRSTDTARPAV
jgi:glycosyltransferase 2 family protein